MGILYILLAEHFSDAWHKSSSLININNKVKSQTKKGDETLNTDNCPHKTLGNNCQAIWHRRPVQKFLWLIAQQWGLNYSSKFFFFLWAISLAQFKWKSYNVHYRSFMNVIFGKSLGRAVICGFLHQNVNTVSVSALKMWMHTVPYKINLNSSISAFFVFSMLVSCFSVFNRCHCMKLCSDFFGAFHVIGTELIGNIVQF